MDQIRGAARRVQAQLLRLLVRDVPRGDVREPLPEELPGDGARRARRRDGVHQQAVARSGRAVAGVREGPEPLLPGVRGRPGRLRRLRRHRSVGRVRPARRPGERAPDPGARTRPTRGRWTATTSTSRPPTSSTPRRTGASSPRPSRRRRPATARSSASSSTRVYGRNDDGTYSPGLDRYFTIGATEQHYRTKSDFFLDRGDEAWGTFTHDYLNNGYVELNYGLWPSHDKDAYDGPFKIRTRRRRRLSSRRRTTRRRPTPARSGSCATSATRG